MASCSTGPLPSWRCDDIRIGLMDSTCPVFMDGLKLAAAVRGRLAFDLSESLSRPAANLSVPAPA